MRLHNPVLHHGSVSVPAPDDRPSREDMELIEEAWTHCDEMRMCLKRLGIYDGGIESLVEAAAQWIEATQENMRAM